MFVQQVRQKVAADCWKAFSTLLSGKDKKVKYKGFHDREATLQNKWNQGPFRYDSGYFNHALVFCVYTYTEMQCSTVPRRGCGHNPAGDGLAEREGGGGRGAACRGSTLLERNYRLPKPVTNSMLKNVTLEALAAQQVQLSYYKITKLQVGYVKTVADVRLPLCNKLLP